MSTDGIFKNMCSHGTKVHYTTHRTYSFTSHPKDEAIMVKCLAQGHMRRDRPRNSIREDLAILGVGPNKADLPPTFYIRASGIARLFRGGGQTCFGVNLMTQNSNKLTNYVNL